MDLTSEEISLWRITDPYDRFLENRLRLISELFARDQHSLDAIILAGTLLTALAYRRYRHRNADQTNFEQLLLDYWPAYVDRVSIPLLVEDLGRRRPAPAELIRRIEATYLIHRAYSQLRQVAEDPSRSTWQAWCRDNQVQPTDRVAAGYSYARILFRDFRNSVQHRLEIADGQEARPIGFDRPFFYANHSGGMRFGFHHAAFEQLARTVISGLRAWAEASMTDIFATEHLSGND